MKTIASISEQDLRSIALPNHGGRYAVISYGDIINKVKEEAAKYQINITNSVYRVTSNGEIATGQYFMDYGNDPDIKMMFAWSNSYNKMRRFSCGIGSYVTVCLNGMLSADYNTFSRKHTGTAQQEMYEQIEMQFKNAAQIFDKMIYDKERMIQKQLTQNEINEIVGKLFMENILGAVQLGIVKNQINKSDYTYSGEKDSLWHLYNHATHALKIEHPMTFDKTHQDLHKIIVDNYLPANFNQQLNIQPEEVMLDVIIDAETDTIEEYPLIEDTVEVVSEEVQETNIVESFDLNIQQETSEDSQNDFDSWLNL
jgi:hypothetical protein